MDNRKKIESLRKKISKWQGQKERCKTAYDETLCIVRLNQLIQNARNKIKNLQEQVDPITEYILLQEGPSKNPPVLYHASDRLKKVLEPRKSKIGTLPKKALKNIDYQTKEWEIKAVYAAPEKIQAIPFGLERVNIMFPGLRTEEEVARLKKSCYLSVNKKTNILEVHYWNHTPTKPVYLYTVERKDFKPILANKGGAVSQWYSIKMITPIRVEKLFPNQVKKSWKRVSNAEWEIKKQKYKAKGFYK